MRKILTIVVLLALLLIHTGSARAETYYFHIVQETVNVFWNADGTMSIDYVWVFENSPSADNIAYIDLGIPNSSFDESTIYADVDGKKITDISTSGYQGSGSGVALGLGSNAIKPGKTGKVHAFVGVVRQVLYEDSTDKNYASAVFAPVYFGSQYIYGTTDLTVTYHLPPGVTAQEPRWHEDKISGGFPKQPQTGFDSENRITYTWRDSQADGSKEYQFGASFPMKYVPDSAIVRTTIFDMIIGGIVMVVGGMAQCCVPLLFIGGIGGIIGMSAYSDRKRRMQYLPPKISIEGHGIKRGLTAIEAAVLMEQPVDTALTMILFSVIKKNAAQVVTRDPLEIKKIEPISEDLRFYEKEFLDAFDQKGAARRRAMQDVMIHLIKAVSDQMKGFSRKESLAYYQDIMKRAWAQVESAGTPEVRSQKYDEVMEWTMLDRDFNDRTRDVFRNQPVFVPLWWGRYDPGFGRSSMTVPTSSSTLSPGSAGLPRVPGADFAASIVTGVQNFAGSVIGNVTDFTSRVTQTTNPVPVSTSSGGGGGGGGGHSSCACACACAGCACACAGAEGKMGDPILIERVIQVSDELVAAFERLAPQLSSQASPPDHAALGAIIESPCSTLYIARNPQRGGEIVGALTLVLYRTPLALHAWIEDVVVDEQMRGHGIGAALTQKAIEHARAAGAKTVNLTSRPSRQAANRLYQHLGFARWETNAYRYDLTQPT